MVKLTWYLTETYLIKNRIKEEEDGEDFMRPCHIMAEFRLGSNVGFEYQPMLSIMSCTAGEACSMIIVDKRFKYPLMSFRP